MRLRDPRARLRDVEVLFERHRDIAGEQRVPERQPPRSKVRKALEFAIRDARFAHKVRGERDFGRTIVGADRATCEQAGAQCKEDESGAGGHWWDFRNGEAVVTISLNGH